MTRFDRIVRVDETASTNDDMAAILGEEHARGLTIVANYQSAGSGRKGRSWIAPRGSALLFTTALPEPVPSEDLWIVPFWIALAVHDALKAEGIEISLQWPNDLLLRDRKAGGILCISRVTGDTAWAACGVGLNLHRPQDPAPLAEIDPAPGFLSDVHVLHRNTLLEAILAAADRRYPQLCDPRHIAGEWQTAAGIPGANYRLRVDGQNQPIEGIALELSPGGALLIESGGARHCIGLADARVLR